MQKIIIQTKDNINIAGLLWDAGGEETALLLHMMPATKEAWIPLAEKLAARGLNVLAIDFRGHGESGGGDYKTFTPAQHYGYFEDTSTAIGYIKQKYSGGEMVMAGASIGANLVLYYMMGTHDIRKGVVLSAGLDYYGVRAIDYVQKLSQEQSVLLTGSLDDGDCGYAAEELYDKATSQKEKIIYETGGHGTDMFQSHSELLEKIAWFFSN